jgi:hypothetical protein
MKKSLFAAVAALCFAAPAFGDAMTPFYGNTAEVKQPDGVVLKYQFNADGSFALLAPDGTKVTGTYKVADGKICVTPTQGQAGCAPSVEGKKIGDTWDVTNDQGQKLTVTLKAGR